MKANGEWIELLSASFIEIQRISNYGIKGYMFSIQSTQLHSLLCFHFLQIIPRFHLLLSCLSLSSFQLFFLGWAPKKSGRREAWGEHHNNNWWVSNESIGVCWCAARGPAAITNQKTNQRARCFLFVFSLWLVYCLLALLTKWAAAGLFLCGALWRRAAYNPPQRKKKGSSILPLSSARTAIQLNSFILHSFNFIGLFSWGSKEIKR